jgi:XTP/dITP diphosphohydrolase
MDKDSSPRLLVATRNLGKAREYSQLLRDIPFEVVTLEQVGVDEEVEETGSTFEENARIKADAYASLSGLLTLADDSGLEVDALGGEPGVRSARYAGPEATDQDRVDLLLINLKDVAWEDRTGRFRCVIAIARPSGEVDTVTGKVEGFIQDAPKGDDGFGYDPVFYVPHLGKTIAELSTDEKNGISHRGQAARKAVALLECMLKAGI